MRVHDFWQHWGIAENPFAAEEARDDPVFERLLSGECTHPDFAKIYGAPDHPTSAVVFGEKGSGKTALRLTMERRFAAHNEQTEANRAWVVPYDDLNATLDTFVRRQHGRDALSRFRLADHQDAILARAVTRLVDVLTGKDKTVAGFRWRRRRVRRMSPHRRMGLCLLAALYDRPAAGMAADRFRRLQGLTGVHDRGPFECALALIFAVFGAVVAWWGDRFGLPGWATKTLAGLGLGLAVLMAGKQLVDIGRALWTAGRVRREIRTLQYSMVDLARRLRAVGHGRASEFTLPLPGDHDSRYTMTRCLLDILAEYGYTGLVVLVDCIDEPALVNGDTQKMRDLVWPMMNNKFLQQERVGVKLLLPIELRYLVRRESEDFFMQARLDKQHLVDRLAWTGSALYDLANLRLRACRNDDGPFALSDLFDESVTTQDVVDALDQMQQPRDAFKLLYHVIHEHCSNMPNDNPIWRIPRLTLVQVAKEQSLRLHEMQRGVEPA